MTERYFLHREGLSTLRVRQPPTFAMVQAAGRAILVTLLVVAELDRRLARGGCPTSDGTTNWDGNKTDTAVFAVWPKARDHETTNITCDWTTCDPTTGDGCPTLEDYLDHFCTVPHGYLGSSSFAPRSVRLNLLPGEHVVSLKGISFDDPKQGFWSCAVALTVSGNGSTILATTPTDQTFDRQADWSIYDFEKGARKSRGKRKIALFAFLGGETVRFENITFRSISDISHFVYVLVFDTRSFEIHGCSFPSLHGVEGALLLIHRAAALPMNRANVPSSRLALPRTWAKIDSCVFNVSFHFGLSALLNSPPRSTLSAVTVSTGNFSADQSCKPDSKKMFPAIKGVVDLVHLTNSRFQSSVSSAFPQVCEGEPPPSHSSSK